MNKLIAILSLAILCITTSCKKASETPVITHPTNGNSIQPGNWHITLMKQNAVDETANFSGYVFAFGMVSSVTAGNGNTIISGTYSISLSQQKLVLSNFPNAWEDLNKDWKLLENTSVRISLTYTNSGNGGTDELVFEKD